MFHISTGLDGEQKKYTKKHTAESSKHFKAWRADRKANCVQWDKIAISKIPWC